MCHTSLTSCYLKAPWEIPGNDPPESWPNDGNVEFQNYSTRYRPGLDLVLKDVSLYLHSGEKVSQRFCYHECVER